MREIVNAIFYVLRGGIAWSLLPKDFPPWSTVYRWFALFRDDGTWERINHHLVMLYRERAGRDASPTRNEVMRKADNQLGFAFIARRWVVDRFFACINRSRRFAKDFEAMIESVEAFL